MNENTMKYREAKNVRKYSYQEITNLGRDHEAPPRTAV